MRNINYFCEACGVGFVENDDVTELAIRETAHTDLYRTYYHDTCVPEKWDRRVYRSVRTVARMSAGEIGKLRKGYVTESHLRNKPKEMTKSEAIVGILKLSDVPLATKEIYTQQDVFGSLEKLRKFMGWLKHKGKVRMVGERGDVRYCPIVA